MFRCLMLIFFHVFYATCEIFRHTYNQISYSRRDIRTTRKERQISLQVLRMRVKIRNVRDLNTVSSSEIFMDTKQNRACTENQREDKAAKELAVRFNPTKQSDNHTNDDVVATSNVKQLVNIVPQFCEHKNAHHENAEIDKTVMQDKVQVTVEKAAIYNMNKETHNKTNRRRNRSQTTDKTSLRKTSGSGKVAKPKVTKKADKAGAPGTNEVSVTLSNQFNASQEHHRKLELPMFRSAFHNYAMFYDNVSPCHGVTGKQQGSQHYATDTSGNNNNRSSLQYVDCAVRYPTSPEIKLQSDPWSAASSSGQNSTFTAMEQNKAGQSSFANDGQSSQMCPAAGYNRRQYENPYLYPYPSVSPMYPYRIYPTRTDDYCSYNNWYPYQNVYSGISNSWGDSICSNVETFPKTNATIPQVANDITPSHVPAVTTSNNFLNAALGSSFVPAYNYQLSPKELQKLAYLRNLNAVNYANNSGRELRPAAMENAISAYNNWHHANRLITSYASNVNIPYTPITSDTLPGCPAYTGNPSAHSSNNHSDDLVKVNVHADRQIDEDNEKRLLQIISGFEDSAAAADTYKPNPEGLNVLPYQNTSAINTGSVAISDITNFLSETAVDEYEKFCMCTKKED